MVLGKLPVPGRPTIWSIVGQGPTALAVGAGGGCLDISSHIYPFSPPPSLWETARYRLKYCLKGPFNSNNQPKILLKLRDGRVVRWSWIKFQCRGVLLVLIVVGQGPTALTVCAVEIVWIFLLSSIISLFFLPLYGRRPDID